MKKLNSLFFAILATFFVSCSNEESLPVAINGSSETAKLTLTFTGSNQLSTRSLGALPTSEDRIGSLSLGVFDKTGNTVLIKDLDLSSIQSKSVSLVLPAGTVDFLLVANAPANHFANAATFNDFKSKTIDLSSTQRNGVQVSDSLPMSGGITDVVLTSGATVNKTISLSRLVSRIALQTVTNAFEASGRYASATFTPDSVFLYNAKTVTEVDSVANPATSVLKSGQNIDYLSSTITGVSLSNLSPTWFYTFANDASSPTKLVITGMFDADGAGTNASPIKTYYPIVINKSQFGTTLNGGVASTNMGNSIIQRNTSYLLSATIKTIGVSDPSISIDPAAVDLTVNVLPWALNITQDVVFQ